MCNSVLYSIYVQCSIIPVLKDKFLIQAHGCQQNSSQKLQISKLRVGVISYTEEIDVCAQLYDYLNKFNTTSLFLEVL